MKRRDKEEPKRNRKIDKAETYREKQNGKKRKVSVDTTTLLFLFMYSLYERPYRGKVSK